MGGWNDQGQLDRLTRLCSAYSVHRKFPDLSSSTYIRVICAGVAWTSFPGLPRFFCSSVSVDNNTRMWKGGETRFSPPFCIPVLLSTETKEQKKQGRPGNEANKLLHCEFDSLRVILAANTAAPHTVFTVSYQKVCMWTIITRNNYWKPSWWVELMRTKWHHMGCQITTQNTTT